MSLFASAFANLPGLTQPVETYEAAWSWGPAPKLTWSSQEIYSGCVDSGNTPTTQIRQGLLLGRRTADGTYSNYSPTATDGTEVASAVLPVGLNMLNLLTLTAQYKFYGLIVGGLLQASKIINLDGQARAQMAAHFQFDDDLIGANWFPWKRFVTKNADYQILSTDNFTQFNNLGDNGAIAFTLPAIANGYCFGFSGQVDQNLAVTSLEGANIIAMDNLVANTLTFSTANQKIGAGLRIYSNPAGTKWIAENVSAGANTVTVS